MKYNKKEYKYFVVDLNDNLIHSGWEFKDDALDVLDELLEGLSTTITPDYAVYTKRYIMHLNKYYNDGTGLNPNNNNNWLEGVK